MWKCTGITIPVSLYRYSYISIFFTSSSGPVPPVHSVSLPAVEGSPRHLSSCYPWLKHPLKGSRWTCWTPGKSCSRASVHCWLRNQVSGGCSSPLPESNSYSSRTLETLLTCRVLLWNITSQGTKAITQLMQELCSLLKIKSLRTSMYHLQTDGLAQQFN